MSIPDRIPGDAAFMFDFDTLSISRFVTEPIAAQALAFVGPFPTDVIRNCLGDIVGRFRMTLM